MTKEAVILILRIRDNLERITISNIGKKIGYFSLLEKQFDKMPLTKAYIESIVESTNDFRIRRVRWAVLQLHEEGEEIKEWKIMKKSGLKPYLSHEMVSVINSALKRR